ncbi:MAG: capsid protein [Sanya dicistrovirus 2]|nr:MAG: capsid protein [Sanya dicistrovirus 2]
MIRQKLQGFRYFRGTAKIRVQVNAQPFNAGMLIIWFNPLKAAMTLPTSHTSHFGGITGYRHVKLNVNKDTHAELKVPFSLNLTHKDLLNGFGELGEFTVSVYSSLTGLDNVDLTVWLSMEDIEVEVPTGFAVVGVDQMDDEADKAGRGGGIISSTARVVSGVAGSLASVPPLARTMKAFGWIADSVAGVAEIFGFSKPQNYSDVTAVVQRIAPDMANFNGVSQAKMMALDSRNSITTMPSMDGSGEDQMSFAHILRKWIYMDRFKFNQTDKPNAVIWYWPVSPMSCRKSVVADSRRLNHETMLSFLGKSFAAWRGTIEYKFRIISTSFHTGRIELAFVPGAAEDDNVANIDFSKVDKKIIDLRETCEYTYSVPFVFNEMFCPVRLTYPGLLEDLRITDSIPTGVLYVRVINSLRNPSTASPSIEVVVETRAGVDFEFAQPELDSLTLMEREEIPFRSIVTDISKMTAAGYSKAKQKPKAKVVKTGTKEQVEEKKAEIKVTELPIIPPEIPIVEWEKGDDIPAFPPKEPMWVKDVDTRTVLWNELVKREGWVNTAGPAQSLRWMEFLQHVKISGVDQMDEMHEFIRSPDRPGVLFDQQGMGEKITSLRQVLKRYNQLSQYASPTTGDSANFLWPWTTGWNVVDITPVSDKIWLGFLDWYSALFRWQSGSMRIGLSVRPGQTTDVADSTISVEYTPPTNREFNDDVGFYTQNKADIPYIGRPRVLLYPDNERFMELTAPFYSHLSMIPTGVGRIPANDYFAGVFLDKIPNHSGGKLRINNAQALDVYRAIGEDFNLDYSLGPPMTSITYDPQGKRVLSVREVGLKQYKEKKTKESQLDAEALETWKKRVAADKIRMGSSLIFSKEDANSF